MPQEKIIIEFKSKGSPELIKALNNLAKAQKAVEKGLADTKVKFTALNPKMLQLHAALKEQGKDWTALGVSIKTGTAALKGNKRAITLVDARLKALTATTQGAAMASSLLGTRNKRLAATNGKLALSFATLRSKMLLISFGAMLIERAFVSLVKAYGRQEAANEKLRVGLGNVQDTTEGVTQRLIDYSAALQQVTAFGDEMITTGMVQLTTFGLNEEAIKALTPQVLNVARAIQTVSGAMPDLNSLFIAFGKATTTGIGTLTRYGVVLTEVERAQLGSMDANESAVKIAEILKRQYGGLAEAYAKTTIGMLEAADAARGDAAEAFGEMLAPAVLAVSEGLKKMFEAMDVDTLRAYGSGALIASGWVLALAIANGTLAASLIALAGTLTTTTGGLFALVIALGATVGAFINYLGIFDEGTKKIKDAEKRYDELAAQMGVTTERLLELAAAQDMLNEAQKSGEVSLQKQLDLLNAKTEWEKMLINLGRSASKEELRLINQIISKTEALKAEAQFKKDLIEINKEIAKLEEAIAKEMAKQAAKKKATEIKALQEAIAALAKEQQKQLDLERRVREEFEKNFPTQVEYNKAMKKRFLIDLHAQTLIKEFIQLYPKEAEALGLIETKQGDLNKLTEDAIRLANQQQSIITQGISLSGDEDAIKQAAIVSNMKFLLINRAVLEGHMDVNAALREQQRLYDEVGVKVEEEITAREQLIGKLDEEQQKRLETAQAALAIGGEMLGQFNNMTSAISAGVNARMKNEMDALKATTKYQRADGDKRKAMEKGVTDSYAKERTRLAKFEKASNLAQAGINIAQAITRVLPNIFLASLVAAMGAVQIGAILGTPIPKFATGGMIGGRRHSQGGTMINAEAGEFVMSRSAVQSVGLESLNRMNEGGGGGDSVTVNVSGNVLTQDFVEGELAENIKEAIRRGTDFGIS